MTDAENIERWTQRKADLVAEAEALLDKQAREDGLTDDEDARYLEIEEALVNVQSMLKHAAAEPADDDRPTNAAWDAVKAMAGG